MTGASGSGGLQYQLAPRTSLSGTYTYSHYDYTHNAGQASVNSIGLTLSHQFPSHWMVTVSGGFSQTHTSGVIEVPVTFIVQQGSTQQAVGGYVLGSYDQSVFIPSYSGSVSRSWHHSSLSVTAGQGVLGSGNGYYLTSRNTYVTGYYSYSIQRRSNVSFGGYYYRLSSVANTVSSAYSTQGFSANYGTMLMRYVGAFARYDFVRYGSLSPLPGVNDNRISFGFNFSSKSIPMTLF